MNWVSFAWGGLVVAILFIGFSGFLGALVTKKPHLLARYLMRRSRKTRKSGKTLIKPSVK